MPLLRLGVVLLLIASFMPALNPIRMSGLIHRNSALVTMSFNYSSMISEFTRALSRGWVMQETLDRLYSSAVMLVIGIAAAGTGCCMSLGKLRLKRIGTGIITIFAALCIPALLISLNSHRELMQTANPERVQPMLADGFWVFISLLAVIALVGMINLLRLPKPSLEDGYEMEPKYRLFLMMLPFVVLCFLFAYLPLWGWRFSLFNYRAGTSLSMDNFSGFRWFTFLFENPASRADITRVMKNTLAMSGIGIATSWLPIAFAVFLAEIKAAKCSRLIQTCTTIPNFISWVLVYSFAFALFSTEGFVNSLLISLGLRESGTNFLMSGDNIWLKMWAWGTWKGLGWSAIIYIAGISGIDVQLYEAATIDGADRYQRMWHVTVPGLIPTFCVLLLLAVAGILSNGMDQYFVFKNAANKNTIEVLDLYVYTLGLGSGGSSNIPLATVVGMLKSIISIILLFGANRISKIIRGESIV